MIEDQEWLEMTVEEARKLVHMGYLVWFRPHMKVYNRDYPDSDLAWVVKVDDIKD